MFVYIFKYGIILGGFMIDYIKGKIVLKSSDYFIIENNEIGYRVNYSNENTLDIGKVYQIHTYQHIKEDENTLFGFLSLNEKELFVKLISVKGLGPKTAMNFFGVASYQQIIHAITCGDIVFLKQLPHIGNKTASQIVLDLKDKLSNITIDPTILNNNVNDAIHGLKSMGYKHSELTNVIELFNRNCSMNTEALLKIGLISLNKAYNHNE